MDVLFVLSFASVGRLPESTACHIVCISYFCIVCCQQFVKMACD